MIHKLYGLDAGGMDLVTYGRKFSFDRSRELGNNDGNGLVGFQVFDDLVIVKALDGLNDSFLKNECGIKNIYVKYHHFDPPSKKEIFNALGVKEISSPNLSYEILHPYLNPEYVVPVGSGALFYCFTV